MWSATTSHQRNKAVCHQVPVHSPNPSALYREGSSASPFHPLPRNVRKLRQPPNPPASLTRNVHEIPPGKCKIPGNHKRRAVSIQGGRRSDNTILESAATASLKSLCDAPLPGAGSLKGGSCRAPLPGAGGVAVCVRLYSPISSRCCSGLKSPFVRIEAPRSP